MPNLAVVLKNEIRRLARKETKASVTPLRKLVTALRRRVAEQRRLIEGLERAARRSLATGKAAAAAAATEEPQIRFSPQWVRAHRKKLKMSRRIYAKLIGVSAQSIFGWEAGRTRPRRMALAAWRRIRAMGAREIKARLMAAKPARGRKAGAKAAARRARGAVARRRGRAPRRALRRGVRKAKKK